MLSLMVVGCVSALTTWFLYTVRRGYPTLVLEHGGILSEESIVAPEPAPPVAWRRILLIWVSVFIGMVTISIYKELQASTGSSLRSIGVQMLTSAILSPLVVRLTLGDADEILRVPLYKLLLVSYQNGFFWEVVLAELPVPVG